MLRVAIGQLDRSRGCTAPAVGALALGLGANTILFSAIAIVRSSGSVR